MPTFDVYLTASLGQRIPGTRNTVTAATKREALDRDEKLRGYHAGNRVAREPLTIMGGAIELDCSQGATVVSWRANPAQVAPTLPSFTVANQFSFDQVKRKALALAETAQGAKLYQELEYLFSV